MFKKGNALVGSGIVLLDSAAVWIGGLLAHRIRFDDWQIAVQNASLMMAASVLMLMVSSTEHRSFRTGAFLGMFGRPAMAWLAVWLALVVWLVAVYATTQYSRIFLATWGIATLLVLFLERGICILVMRWFRSQGYNERSVLLVGDGPVTNQLRSRIDEAAWTGYRITRTIDAADLELVKSLGESGEFHEVWINLGIEHLQWMPQLLTALHQSTAEIRMVPDLFAYRMMNYGTTAIAGVPMVDISVSPISGFGAVIKKIEDYVLASLILVVISPLLIIIALIVKTTSDGPIFYRQRRHGWNGEPIWVYKFRTMNVHAEPGGSVTQAQRDDPRLTSVGPFLRRTSLDELPQFINVLQGRMSVVGPRPHALEHNLHYKDLIPRYMLRHKVKPGITGWAQVNGYRGATETIDKMKARVDHDLFYLEQWSVWFDLRIVAMTITRGFLHRNAY